MVTRAYGGYIDQCHGDSTNNGQGYLPKFEGGTKMFWLNRIMGRVWAGSIDSYCLLVEQVESLVTMLKAS